MEETHRKPPHQPIWQWMQRNQDAAFAIIMAGVAALFIIGIVSAFNYAASDRADAPPATLSSITAGRIPVETTGAGGGERPRPPQQDPREDEQIERVR
jgi:hypothetical protein